MSGWIGRPPPARALCEKQVGEAPDGRQEGGTRMPRAMGRRQPRRPDPRGRVSCARNRRRRCRGRPPEEVEQVVDVIGAVVQADQARAGGVAAPARGCRSRCRPDSSFEAPAPASALPFCSSALVGLDNGPGDLRAAGGAGVAPVVHGLADGAAPLGAHGAPLSFLRSSSLPTSRRVGPRSGAGDAARPLADRSPCP